MKRSLLFTMLIFTALGMSPLGNASQDQQKEAPRDEDLSTLKKEVGRLGEQQQQIIGELNEIMKLLSTSSVTSPSPQVPSHPPTLNVQGETFRGNSGARAAIIEYADFQCPYCGEYERQVFPQLLKSYIETGKVKYFYRDLPLPGHTRALPAAHAARCAGEQGKYWEMHDSLFARQNALSDQAFLDRAKILGLDSARFAECLSSEAFISDIQKSFSEAQSLRIEGTPTFFLGIVEPNGDVSIQKRFQGEAPFDVFRSALDTLLASKNQEAISPPDF